MVKIFVILRNKRNSDLASLDPRWFFASHSSFFLSKVQYTGLGSRSARSSEFLAHFPTKTFWKVWLRSQSWVAWFYPAEIPQVASLSLMLLALDLTLLLYRWQCQHFFWWKILRRAGPLSCRRTVNFSTIGRAISLMMMSKSWLENSQHDKNKFKDTSLGRPFGPPSRRFR